MAQRPLISAFVCWATFFGVHMVTIHLNWWQQSNGETLPATRSRASGLKLLPRAFPQRLVKLRRAEQNVLQALSNAFGV
jgi:hypothetical protein